MKNPSEVLANLYADRPDFVDEAREFWLKWAKDRRLANIILAHHAAFLPPPIQDEVKSLVDQRNQGRFKRDSPATKKIAEALGVSPKEAAWFVTQLIDVIMASSLYWLSPDGRREISGTDPHEWSSGTHPRGLADLSRPTSLWTDDNQF
ncbi:MAG: hypothetical protein GF390_01860 [Candidatus Pacebacteria bacterium]|nr:hypothetical protein [Candidatus Paceibacterota bacterium]